MAKKITRLGDPANPYSQKKTPTSAPSAAQKAVNRATSQRQSMAAANQALKPKPVLAPAVPVAKRLSTGYAASRNKMVDDAVSGKPRKPR